MKQSIDVTKIENFDTADADALRKFIKEFSFEDNADEVKRITGEMQKLKDRNTELSSENADWKRKHQETLTAEQKAAEEREEAEKAKDALIASLQKEKALADFKARYADIGYSAEQAERAANAMFDGKTDELFAVQREYMEEHDKAIKIENMKGTPTPPAGTGGENELTKMSYEEISKFLGTHPGATID